MRPLPAMLLCLLILPACAPRATTDRPERNELVRSEILELEERNTLDLLRLRRPHWLRTRGQTNSFAGDGVVVYVDGMRRGGLDVLSYIQSVNVERIVYFGAREAQVRWGMGHVNGAIEVVTRDH